MYYPDRHDDNAVGGLDEKNNEERRGFPEMCWSHYPDLFNRLLAVSLQRCDGWPLQLLPDS